MAIELTKRNSVSRRHLAAKSLIAYVIRVKKGRISYRDAALIDSKVLDYAIKHSLLKDVGSTFVVPAHIKKEYYEHIAALSAVIVNSVNSKLRRKEIPAEVLQ